MKKMVYNDRQEQLFSLLDGQKENKMITSKYGIELENYHQGGEWEFDGSGVYEKASGVESDFKTILNYTKDTIKGVSNIKFHSSFEGRSTVSAHIHRSPISYRIMDHLFKLTNIFQFFFKNSPKIKNGDNFLSSRHIFSTWCKLVRFKLTDYNQIHDRQNHALTLNEPTGEGRTIEFRYNDFPKSLNQLALFYYLNSIVNKINANKDIFFEFKLIRLATVNDLNKEMHLGKFTYKNPDSFLLFNSSYIDIIKSFSKDIDLLLSKWKFYDFYDGTHKKFSEWIESSFKKEASTYKKFFDEKWSDQQWSDYWEKDFFKEVPSKLIKSTDEDQRYLD